MNVPVPLLHIKNQILPILQNTPQFWLSVPHPRKILSLEQSRVEMEVGVATVHTSDSDTFLDSCGIHLADNFFIPSSSVNMRYTHSDDIPTASAISVSEPLTLSTLSQSYLLNPCKLDIFNIFCNFFQTRYNNLCNNKVFTCNK